MTNLQPITVEQFSFCALEDTFRWISMKPAGPGRELAIREKGEQAVGPLEGSSVSSSCQLSMPLLEDLLTQFTECTHNVRGHSLPANCGQLQGPPSQAIPYIDERTSEESRAPREDNRSVQRRLEVPASSHAPQDAMSLFEEWLAQFDKAPQPFQDAENVQVSHLALDGALLGVHSDELLPGASGRPLNTSETARSHNEAYTPVPTRAQWGAEPAFEHSDLSPSENAVFPHRVQTESDACTLGREALEVPQQRDADQVPAIFQIGTAFDQSGFGSAGHNISHAYENRDILESTQTVIDVESLHRGWDKPQLGITKHASRPTLENSLEKRSGVPQSRKNADTIVSALTVSDHERMDVHRMEHLLPGPPSRQPAPCVTVGRHIEKAASEEIQAHRERASSAKCSTSLTTPSVDIGMNSCTVCGSARREKYHRAPWCRACRMFFLNTIRRTAGECQFWNECSISAETRSKCSSCRLEKCIEKGMRPGE